MESYSFPPENPRMKTTLTPLRLLRVSARLMSIVLFLLWGTLFLEHLAWFFSPTHVPPLYVWVGQIIHLGLLASYVLGFWKEKLASAGMVIFSFLFFVLIIGNPGGIVFFVLSSLPGGLYALCWGIAKKQNKKGHSE
jgi:ABC-type proline/glycine betaine transport system permease subunit